jgi:cobalt-zinc-cadmium efflux system membrane fusion protein
VVLVPPLAGFYSYFSGVPLHLLAAKNVDTEAEESDAAPSISLVSGRLHTLEISDEVAVTLGICKGEHDAVAVAQPPTMMRPLVLPGSTSLDPTRLARIRARFAPARVVSLGQVWDFAPKQGHTEYRELRQGDPVSKGDILGIFSSVEVGSKKNDLLQALVQLKLDQVILERIEKNRYAVPEVYYLTELRAVQGDRNEVHRALNNLKLWDIPQDEIDALHAEASKISADKDAWMKTPEGRWVSRCTEKEAAAASKEAAPSKTATGTAKDAAGAAKDAAGAPFDPDKESENPWGRVTLRAPFDGVVVERNVHVDEIVVDNTVNLFQIADVSRLLVLANCPEDSVPALEALGRNERKWTVQTVGAAVAAGLSGTIDEIGYIIDPNQHTAVIKGYVENPGKHIRAGQYVAATVNIPPPAGVVQIPVDALVDDGKQSLVFVQPDAAKHQFTMRRVHVRHRFDRTVFVQDTPIPKAEQLTALEAEEGLLPKQPLRRGERVLVAGSVELKRVAIDLESRRQARPDERLARARLRPASAIESRSERKRKAGKG